MSSIHYESGMKHLEYVRNKYLKSKQEEISSSSLHETITTNNNYQRSNNEKMNINEINQNESSVKGV